MMCGDVKGRRVGDDTGRKTTWNKSVRFNTSLTR
jgi:hypothetical protein